MHEGQADVVDRAVYRLRHVRARVSARGQVVPPRPRSGARAVRTGRARGGQRGASFAAVYPAWQRRRLPSALRRLGFAYVGETAIGAYHVALATAAASRPRPGGRILHRLSGRGPLHRTLSAGVGR